MQGPVIDLVLLLVLIVFLGSQQRSRPQPLYLFWFIGWMLVLVSLVVWEFKLTQPVVLHMQEALRFDLLLAGLLTVMLSFLPTPKNLVKTIGTAMVVGVPTLMVINASEFVAVPRPLLIGALLCWQVYSLREAYAMLPKGRVKTRQAILTICGLFIVALPLYVAISAGYRLEELICVEVLLCTAVLYGGGLQRRSFAVRVGMFGFVAWAFFYLVAGSLSAHPEMQRQLFMLWNIPKYIVGLSMIMKMLEDASEENARLAQDFQSIYAEHMNPMWIYECESGVCLSVNAAALDEYGYTEEEFLALNLDRLEVPNDAEKEWMDEMVPAMPGGVRTRHLRSDGEIIWVNVTQRDLMFQGRKARLVLSRDVTDKVKAQRELAHRAHHDGLTGLPNRMLLADRIRQCMARCGRDGRKAVLLMIDVDHFKRINDTYGHLVGDECLQMVAARMAVKIRQVDTIARVGGEEFSAIIGGLQHLAGAEKIAESILRVFDAPLQIGDLEIPVSVSIGMAVYPDDGLDARELKDLADRALYAAKRLGRNCAVLAGSQDRALRFSQTVELRLKEHVIPVEVRDFSTEATN